MTITSFANFVSKSYGFGAGGGAIGALLAWPLYRNLGVAGGFIGALLIAVLLLTATGRMGRFVRFIAARSAEARAIIPTTAGSSAPPPCPRCRFYGAFY